VFFNQVSVFLSGLGMELELVMDFWTFSRPTVALVWTDALEERQL